MKAVCDSTVLIGLAKIGRLELLGQQKWDALAKLNPLSMSFGQRDSG